MQGASLRQPAKTPSETKQKIKRVELLIGSLQTWQTSVWEGKVPLVIEVN